jgi:topoisomerase-4 subunit B
MPGVVVSLTNEKTGETLHLALQGRPARLPPAELPADPLIPLFEGEHYADGGETENNAEGEGAAWCVAFTEDGATHARELRQPDPDSGRRHARVGLKDGLFGAIKGFIDLHALLPKGVKLMPEDVFSRASFVLSRPRCWTRSSRARSRSA